MDVSLDLSTPHAILTILDIVDWAAVPHQVVTSRHGTRPHDPDESAFFSDSQALPGLLDFDPYDVRSSVPHLLGGIRTGSGHPWLDFWALTLKIRSRCLATQPYRRPVRRKVQRGRPARCCAAQPLDGGRR